MIIPTANTNSNNYAISSKNPCSHKNSAFNKKLFYKQTNNIYMPIRYFFSIKSFLSILFAASIINTYAQHNEKQDKIFNKQTEAIIQTYKPLFQAAIKKFTQKSMKPNGNWHIYDASLKKFKLCKTNDFITCENKKIAIVVHGFIGRVYDLTYLARTLHHHKRYDLVLGYHYNTTPGIKKIASLLATDIKKIADKNTIELYGYSQGGLVCRWILEKEGLGKKITRLITFGTPHIGVPVQVFKPIIDLLPENLLSVSDMVTKTNKDGTIHYSQFLKELNAGTSPYIDQAEYYTIAGNNHKTFRFGMGYIVQKAYETYVDKNIILEPISLSNTLELGLHQ